MHSEEHLRLLEATHTFPSDHRFHVILRAEHADTFTALLVETFGLDPAGQIVPVQSRNGTYTAVRFTLNRDSAAAVIEVYAFLGSLSYLIKVL